MTASLSTALFICVHNAGRSEIAAGFLAALGGDAVEVRSARSLPADQINPIAVEVITELGVDNRAEVPTALTTDAVTASAVVITMGCGDACPISPASTMRIGRSPIRPGGASMPCVRSGTTFARAS